MEFQKNTCDSIMADLETMERSAEESQVDSTSHGKEETMKKDFINKKKQTPSKVTKLHSEPPKKGESMRVDGMGKTPPLSKKKTPASSTGSGLSLDKKAAVPWLTPVPSKKANSVAAKVDLLGEFQSALPKMKRHSTRSQKKAPQKKNPPQNNATQNSTKGHLKNKCSGASQKLPWKMVALDCNMVGRGPKGHVSSLARCSIVNYDGDVLYDEYIFPPCHIVDYQTKWSGICKKHMENAKDCSETYLEDDLGEDCGGACHPQ
ncbi:Interferon-stimulated 20 kDa exonuclease-like 2 [Sciurus carolinensis]|uniref:Interferon-stimulated 20 kDa exonuclease-like 2 n=1 Tax=Sciurus carolinensis TaxID=30640 RepID=A0AA41MGE8_SCICA|nr:Interferon-stimulated 20 kDa exonuclease-like 2 [Sciurus carolinensis]